MPEGGLLGIMGAGTTGITKWISGFGDIGDSVGWVFYVGIGLAAVVVVGMVMTVTNASKDMAGTAQAIKSGGDLVKSLKPI